MSHGKQFTLYSHIGGPNGWKVAFVLEELGLTYETKFLDFKKQEQKGTEHVEFNPNGRIPTLIDHHNNDFVLWESGAIIQYLVDKYDSDHKISADNEDDKYKQLQWLFFQASGQGPYFGQAFHFLRNHSEKIPSAIERYQNETRRVLGVLESILSKQEWLVGGKLSVADLAFMTWNNFAVEVLLVEREDINLDKEFPAVLTWHAKLKARDSVSKLLSRREVLLKGA